jgi:transglutaminase-like putative cysteine protease
MASWFYEKAKALARDCKTATEAVQVLNRDFFNRIQVHYHTGRKAPNQSPAESMASGKATCTGLSIIFVNACRAVGIPARVAGTALWTGKMAIIPGWKSMMALHGISPGRMNMIRMD